MLKISWLKTTGLVDSKNTNRLWEVVMNKLDVSVDLVTKTEENQILLLFNNMRTDNDWMESSESNYIPLDPNGEKAKKIGRNYLKTAKVNEEQYDKFMSTILGILHDLEIHSFKMVITYRDKEFVITKANELFDASPLLELKNMRRFPISKKEFEQNEQKQVG